MYIVTCPRCGYRWVYDGDTGYARCPKCHTKFSVRRHGFAVSREKLRSLLSGVGYDRFPDEELRLYRAVLEALVKYLGFVRVSELERAVGREGAEQFLEYAKRSPDLAVIHADGDAAVIHRELLWRVYVALRAAPVAEGWWSRLSRVERGVVRFLREARLIWFDRSEMRWRLSNLIHVMATPTQPNRATV